jgi:dTDP-4-dehydrorhamnose 3,5-epimerase
VFISEKNSESMGWIQTNFEGVWVFEPKVWNDARGYFVETFNASGLPDELQGHFFCSGQRGSISQRCFDEACTINCPRHAQSKLVRVVQGEVLDVIVDLRKESATYGKHLTVILNDIQKKQLFVPKGFAHGYIVLSSTAIFAYKCDEFYNPDADAGIKFDDPALGIDWLLPAQDCIASEKDRNLPNFDQHKPF